MGLNFGLTWDDIPVTFTRKLCGAHPNTQTHLPHTGRENGGKRRKRRIARAATLRIYLNAAYYMPAVIRTRTHTHTLTEICVVSAQMFGC